MAAWRCEMSLLVLEKYFTIFFNTRREISYLQVAMYYILYLLVT